ncbi:MAG: T9SS type A sorting domain-containing protein [Crocinitomicaceae bacterium]|nr:T9SS type A sorting domain-containing protein [Crocinitomicaceae bacterium]
MKPINKTKQLVLLVLSILFNTTGNTQVIYHVDQVNGDNSNNGITSSSAFQSIDSAIDVVNPSDTILIMGMYTNSSYNSAYTYSSEHDPHLWHAENAIKINNLHGNSAAYITIKAYDNSTILKGDGANIFRVSNSSYLRIEDFEIEGEVQNIPLTTANALQFVYIDVDNTVDSNNPTALEIKYRDQDCISNCTVDTVVNGEIYSDISSMNIARPSYIDTRGLYLSNVHHIDIINNVIHDMPGGGLRVSNCEDINIRENEIYACSRKSYSGTHGLVVTKATSTRTTDDYRISIIRNKVHHNYNEQYSWSPSKTIITPHIDEGKGISLQRNQTTNSINWDHGRILVENNICYYNGFSGIHSNDGNRIDFINNTSYFNSYTKSITEGITSNNGGNIGISAQGGSDIRIVNNISIIDKNLSKSAISSNLTAADGLIVKNNIIYGTDLNGVTDTISEDSDISILQVNTQKIDPLFVAPLNFDFSLQQNSPAINTASVLEAPVTDYFGTNRDMNPDIGAIEYSNISGLEGNSYSFISIYPNPVNEMLCVKGLSFLKSDVKITNALGQECSNFKMIGDQLIDVSNLSSGFYIIKIKTFVNRIHKL